jgi:hypothetical protein
MASRIRFRRFYECDTESDRSLDFGADSLLYCLDTQKYYRIYNSSYQEVQPDEVIFISPIPVSKLGISGIPDGTKFLRDDGSWSSVPGGANVVSGVGTAGQVAYWTNTSILSGSSTFAFTPTSQLLVNNTVTASGAAARGINFTPTLIAAANNDVLSALEIAPTFTNGAFTGVSNYGIWIKGGSLAGPNNATFNILSVVPTQVATSVAGNSLTLSASNAVGGLSGNSAAQGGAVNINGGTAGGVGNGGGGPANGGAININAGNNTGGYSNGSGGNIILTAGSSSTNIFGATLTIQGAQTPTLTGGSVTLTAGSSTVTGGAVNITSGAGGSGGNIAGSINIQSGNAGTAGPISINTIAGGNRGAPITIETGLSDAFIAQAPNINLITGLAGGGGIPGNIIFTTGSVPASNNSATGSFIFTTGSGNLSPTSSVSNPSGSFTVTIGTGNGIHPNATGTAGNAGAISFIGGTGGTGAGTTGATAGNGSNITLTSGNGGNATGTSGTRIGGNSGSLTFATGTPGTGATANGTVGSILFKVNSTSTVLEIGYASGAPRIGFFNSTPVPKPSAVTSSQGIADALSSLGLLSSSTIAGGGGHQIVDSANTVYTQREKLKFARLSVADDSLNNQTIVTRPADTFVGTTPPGSPVEGDVWTNSETWNTYKYYDSYWVEVSSTTLPTNVISDSGNKLYLFNSY